MSNCVVEWMNHKFSSREKFLDAYKDDALVKEYGELIFNAPNSVLTQILLKKVTKESEKLRLKYKEAKLDYMDGELSEIFKSPYVGVTDFLRGLKSGDRYLHPDFIEENYFWKRILAWKDPTVGFDEDEKELFGRSVVMTDDVSEEELKEYIKNYDTNPDTDNETLKLVRQIKEKWEFQAKSGTAIHDVLAMLFTKVKKEGANYGKLTIDLDEDVAMLSLKSRYNQLYLNKELVKLIVQYAKKLKAELEEKLGGNLSFFPEFTISSKLALEVPGKGDTILGKIDLLVIDSKGNAHVIDYKVSPKNSFNSAKELGFYYLLGIYNRMLLSNNIRTNSDGYKVMVAPIKITNFRKEGDKFVFDKIEARDLEAITDITVNSTLHEVARKLDEFIPEKIRVNLTPEKTIENVTNFSSQSFPNISTNKDWNDEAILKQIQKNGGILFDNKTNLYYVDMSGKSYKGDSEVEVFNLVKKFYTEVLPKMQGDLVTHVMMALKKGIKYNTTEISLPKTRNLDTLHGASADWIKNIIGKYCHDYMEIVENDTLKKYGIICIHNAVTNLVDFLKITTDNILFQHKFNELDNRTLLTGAHRTDLEEAKKPGSLAMKATTGNIHLMETLAVINCMPELTLNGAVIGEILVADPSTQTGMAAGSNEELLYNFNELADNIEGYENNVKNMRFASKLDLARNRFEDILKFGERNNWNAERYSKYKSQKSLLTELDGAISEADEKKALTKLESLRTWLEKEFANDVIVTRGTYNEDANIARSLYEKVILAMAELKGISFRLQFKDNEKWLEKKAPWKGGVQSLMLDNPGNLNNDTLNLLTRLVTEAYLNVREDMLREMNTMRGLVEELKEAKGFNKFVEMTTGNAASLFKNMIEYKNGDILFKNPWDPTAGFENETERKFLKYVLTRINLNRFGNTSEEDIEELRIINSPKYFRVPLAAGDFSSRTAALGGLMKAYRQKLERLNPLKAKENLKTIFKESQEKLTGVFEEESVNKDENTLFKMNNMFETGEIDSERRLDLIREKGVEYFEHNLETLLLKHVFAYSNLKHINAVMPMAKAAHIHLVAQGNLVNKAFVEADNYVADYVRTKIKNESLIGENHLALAAMAGKLRSAASFMLLGFSPIQYGGQLMQGLWTDIRLILLNLGDKNVAFTFENFKFAFQLMYHDMFKLGSKPTKCSLLNEFFGINDMDMNTYVDKIKSDKYGFFNFSNIAFHNVSRPDFYNRMTIFIAEMKKDGVWDAYSVKDGSLVYNWKKDKRFEAFANNDKSDIAKYNEQRGLYYAIAEQLEKEHALNTDGTYFKVGQPLPKAYTNLQVESYKSISDNIYGYYTHEKKAMVHSMLIGSMWMQMRTFWSGKKNLYLGSSGVKLQGLYVHYKDADGDLWYWKEENGKMIPTKENTGVPLLRWEGLWQEGIILSLNLLWNDARLNGVKNTWHDFWHDPNYKVAKANTILLAYDFLMFAFIGSIIAALMGDWEDELEKNAKKSNDMYDALVAAAANVALKTVEYSFLDFNMLESIGAPIWNWEPVSLNFFTSRAKDLWNTAIGDQDFSKTVIKSSGALSSTRIFWNTLANQ